MLEHLDFQDLDIAKAKSDVLDIKKTILDVGFRRGPLHFGSTLSCVDFIYLLYKYYIDLDIGFNDRNVFILSKAHAALAIYATLVKLGRIESHDLIENFGVDEGPYPPQCHKNTKLGIDISAGSLGLGLGYATGIALADKMRNVERQIFVLLGNGECNEGSTLESLMYIGDKKLNNMTIIIDHNKMQLDGNSSDIVNLKGSRLNAMLKSMNFSTYSVDGHNLKEIAKILLHPTNKAKAIILNTIKGKGISFMENNYLYHHNKIDSAQYELALQEIEDARSKL